jgi:peroxiredoxin
VSDTGRTVLNRKRVRRGTSITKEVQMPLKMGDTAPEFALRDANRNKVSLADFKGKKTVVLAFYILAFTPG